jgi:hypothetical protein
MVVDWFAGSPFLQFAESLTARYSARWKPRDRLDALCEVYRGLRPSYEQDQILVGTEIARISVIVKCRTSNYFHSQGVRSRRQPVQSLSELENGEISDSRLIPPDEAVAMRELLEILARELSRLPPRQAAAVRSRFGYPGAPRCSELALRSGTSRQNESKHSSRGLDKLRRSFEKSSMTRPAPATSIQES